MTANRVRVVITGIGVVSPLGLDTETFWKNLVAGQLGVGQIEQWDTSDHTCKIAAEIKDFKPDILLNDKKLARRLDRFAQFAVIAARQAWEESKLGAYNDLDKERVGVVIGNGSGAINTMDAQAIIGRSKGFRKVTPFLIPMIIPDTASGHVSIEFGLQGPHMSIATACATGADAIGTAMRMIQAGEIDAAIAGGAEAGITQLGIAGFANARALSTRNEDPAHASRPFDKDRDGFVMGEGGCILTIERLEHAQARGATILGEILGYGRTSDGYEVTSPRPDGKGSVRAMQLALKEAQLAPELIGYINAHATSTPVGDTSEANAVVSLFGERARAGNLPVSSTKSMTGHMLGAAGAIEAVASLLAIRDKVVPPTMNVENQDPEIELNTVPNKAQEVSDLTYAMSNSFGFFGHNASLILAGPPAA